MFKIFGIYRLGTFCTNMDLEPFSRPHTIETLQNLLRKKLETVRLTRGGSKLLYIL